MHRPQRSLALLYTGLGLTLVGAIACGGDDSGTSARAQRAAASACESPVVLTPASSGSLADADGNTWTLTSDGRVLENGQEVPGGAGTSALTIVASAVWGEDAKSGGWYTWTNAMWNGPSGNPLDAAAAGCDEAPAPTILTTTSGGSVQDSAGNTWSLGSDGVILENGNPVPGGAGTAELTSVNGVIWGQDARSGGWYSWSNNEWVGPSASPGGGTGTSPSPSSAFSVRNGQIIDPSGRVFVARGIDLGPDNMSEATADRITQMFPGINFIRFATSYAMAMSIDDYKAYVEALTSQGIVVEIEDHPWPAVNPYTGQQLQDELSWYTQLASAFANNQYVWFGTMNEPQSDYGDAESAITTQEVATYDAIRGTGSNAIIMMELMGGGNPGTIGAGFGFTVSSYATMTNIAWDFHYYGWPSSFSTDQSVVTADLLGSVSGGYGIAAAQSIQSADGLVPVIIGEYANSRAEANGEQVLTAVMDSGYGCAAWHWGGTTDDDLALVADGSLTHFGQEVATGIAQRASQ